MVGEMDFSGKIVAGVDEVGRGPLVGAVVAAAVILDPAQPIEGLKDSKKLTEKRRVALCAEIKQKALAWAVGRAEASEIDQINILQASLLAMQRAVLQLSLAPEHVLVDGNRLPELPFPAEAIIKGDQLVAAISAASIVAKVTRDEELVALDALHPQYGFAQHKGYPTAQHMQAIAEFGVIDCHRRSFAPVRNYLLKKESQHA